MNVAQEITNLQRLSVKDLRDKYAELFDEETNAGNKAWLVKRIAWRLQAVAEGGLSERARQRAAELANDADLRLLPPKAPTVSEPTKSAVLRIQNDKRLPTPGTIITRKYRGETLQVKVLPHGFEYLGQVFGSLSAVAREITGSHVNGYLFFRLGNKETK